MADDVKRLLIQEKGEQDYYFLYKKKMQQLKTLIEDDEYRNNLINSLKHSKTNKLTQNRGLSQLT